MHFDPDMAHAADLPDIHSHAAARWLAGFTPIFVAAIIAAFAMLLYPHVSG
jgi:hypothetical protein